MLAGPSRCQIGRFVGFQCVAALILGVAILLSAIFRLPPFLRADWGRLSLEEGWICYAEKTLGSYTTFISSVKIPQQAIGATIKHHICQKSGSNGNCLCVTESDVEVMGPA